MTFKPHFFLLLFVSAVLLIPSCKDDNGDNADIVRPSLLTLEAVAINNNEAVLGGDITDLGSGIESRGVCYGTFPNPSFDGNMIVSASGTGLGPYSVEVTQLTAGTEYHARAWAQQSDGGVTYGQNVSFMTDGGLMFNTTESEVVTTTTIQVRTEFSAGGLGVEERGWVYSTSSNPTFGEDAFLENLGLSITMENTLEGLQADTDYFIRPFAESNTGTQLYGDELIVHTAGYEGPGGGIVLYDKGIMTGGWRYLEADVTPTDMRQWGCQGTIVNGTSDEIGSGATNTVTIIGDCSNSTIAAAYCQNHTAGGQSDWFLPSQGSLQVLLPSMYYLGTVSIENSYWSSTESGSSSAIAVNNANGWTDVISSSKISTRTVLPVRRF